MNQQISAWDKLRVFVKIIDFPIFIGISIFAGIGIYFIGLKDGAQVVDVIFSIFATSIFTGFVVIDYLKNLENFSLLDVHIIKRRTKKNGRNTK